MTTIISLFMWSVSAALLVLWYPILLVCAVFDRDPVRYRTGRLFRKVGVLITRLNPLWRVRVRGADTLDATTPFVVVSNHQSMADIPVLSHLPWEMKWMAKKELFDLPIIGWQLKLAGDIPVARSDPRSAVKALRRARALLEQRCSVMIFAEGTRARDGNLGPFLPGAFRLAIDAGVPLLPVVVDGTSDCLPKDSWRFGKAREIRVDVLEPIDTSDLKRTDVEAFKGLVQARMQTHLAQMRAASDPRVGRRPEPEGSSTGVLSAFAQEYTYEEFFD